MSLWERIKQAARSFMTGRQGSDSLSSTMIWAGVICYILGSSFGVGILALLGFLAYGVAIFRMFSRNKVKRSEENRRYLHQKNRLQKSIKQAKVRFSNRKKYKYFKCPDCKAWLKIKKGAGVVNVTCGRCQNHFTEKA